MQLCVLCNYHTCKSVSSAEEEEDVEVAQSYVSQYESMQITAILQPYSAHKLTEVQLSSPPSQGNLFVFVTMATLVITYKEREKKKST